MARSSEVNRVEPTKVLRSCTRGGRSSDAIPDVETRPETETRLEPERDNPAEIQVSMSAICEAGLGATRSDISETASQYVTADKSETTATFPASQEIVVESNPKFNHEPKSPSSQMHCSYVVSQHGYSRTLHDRGTQSSEGDQIALESAECD